MAWSERAREAAREARRRKSKQRVVVTSARGAKVRVSRDLYAQKIRTARTNLREMRSQHKDMQSYSIEHMNRSAKLHGGAYAAAAKRRSRKSGSYLGPRR